MDMRTPPKLKAKHRLKVRYGETDQMGVVYHANYLIWFHEARDELVRSAGLSPAEIEKQGWQFPVIEAACQYHASARYGDEIDVTATLVIQSVARMDITYVATRVGCKTRIASGSTRSAITDASGRMLLRTPEHLLSALVSAAANRDSRGTTSKPAAAIDLPTTSDTRCDHSHDNIKDRT